MLTLAAGRSARMVSSTFFVTTSGVQPALTASFSISGNSPLQIDWMALTRSRSAFTAATAASFAAVATSVALAVIAAGTASAFAVSGFFSDSVAAGVFAGSCFFSCSAAGFCSGAAAAAAGVFF